MNLFEHRAKALIKQEAPLAARMRPRDLDEYVGQEHIMGPGRLLRRAIEADRLSSLIFYGPPGTGKTTLAQVIAKRTQAHFASINAVLAGVKDLRKEIEAATNRRGQHGQRTLLFVDEVHRFNKAQQDALLPWVERGTLTLIGATTENPYFEVNKALISRSRVFQLESLQPRHLHAIMDAALSDPERGYGEMDVVVEPKARAHMVDIANGDARSLLGALELAVETTPPSDSGVIHVDLLIAQESIQKRAVLYDKEGDAHFDTISAFIKSLRGSDPDASMYWLARMVYAGEDPRFIFRRLVIFASEDVGLAAPEAASVVIGLAQAFDRVGMPEGRYPLAQATLYLATAPKSNSTMGFFDALAAVAKESRGEVPNHLKDGSRDKDGFGHGTGYLYPHAYRDHWVAQQYLPSGLQGRLFYTPSDQGYESSIHDQVMRRRDAQLAAMVEQEEHVIGPLPSQGKGGAGLDAWMARTAGNASQRLSQVRDALFEVAQMKPHHVVLDLRAHTGLLMWEALRWVPQGGVWARCEGEEQAEGLAKRAKRLPEMQRPVLFSSSLGEIDRELGEHAVGVAFDRVVGLNLFADRVEMLAMMTLLLEHLSDEGRVILASYLPGQTQRIWALHEDWDLAPDVLAKWREAEEALYAQSASSMPSEKGLVALFEEVGLEVTARVLRHEDRRVILTSQLDHWLAPAVAGQKMSYLDHLSRGMEEDELEEVERVMRQRLDGQEVLWRSASVVVSGRRKG